MGYDALNLGEMEIFGGRAVIRRMNEVANFSLISSNVHSAASLWEPYLIKEIDGVRVAILGLLPPRFPIKESIASVEAPQVSLKRFMEDLKEKADIFVLLSHMGKESTLDLVQEIPGIDIAVIGGHKAKDPMEGERVADTLVIRLGTKGEYIGVIDMTWDARQKGIVDIVHELHPLDKDIPDDTGIIEVVEAFNRDINTWREEEYRRKEMQSQDMQALVERALKMTPEEFHEFFREEMQKREDIRP
jgi:2',3'-cyclic-nucleotide 2'-phosphodiesterase (5'-nucleotidase family)